MHFNGFYFNPLSVKINVESQTGLDPSGQKVISKIFHNKIVTFPFEASKSFAKTIDPGFLLEVLGPAGFLLLILSPVEIFRRKRKLGFIHLTVVLAVLIFSLRPISPKIAFWAVSISFYTLSLWGIGAVVKNKYISFFFIVLIFYSLWYFAINWQMPALCNEIFFN
ncbi:MAG: hypothetical protein Q7S45_04115 [Candidatus Curtissbacteria bacterium]|nr:hypothetical protein [Candidatus Curtissbacteria bacterium]